MNNALAIGMIGAQELLIVLGILRRDLRRPRQARPNFLLLELRADAPEQRRRRHHRAGRGCVRQRASRRFRLRRPAPLAGRRARRTRRGQLPHAPRPPARPVQSNNGALQPLQARRHQRAQRRGLNALSRGTALENRDQSLAVSLVTMLGQHALSETRLQFTRSRLAAPVNDEVGPAVNISGVASFGAATFSPTRRDADVFEAVSNLTAQSGAHAYKLGVDYLQTVYA